MNKEGLKALLSIAKKQGWNGKPAAEFITVTLQFSEDMGISIQDISNLLFITSSEGLQYLIDTKEEEEAMMEELAWYNHARMMGWE